MASADRPLLKRKYDLTVCLRELLEHGVITLGRGQTDVKQLFWKRSKGSYVVVCYEGEYFRQPQAARTQSQQKAIQTDPLFEPLRQLGLDAAAIRRVFAEHTRGRIPCWRCINGAIRTVRPRRRQRPRGPTSKSIISGSQVSRSGRWAGPAARVSRLDRHGIRRMFLGSTPRHPLDKDTAFAGCFSSE